VPRRDIARKNAGIGLGSRCEQPDARTSVEEVLCRRAVERRVSGDSWGTESEGRNPRQLPELPHSTDSLAHRSSAWRGHCEGGSPRWGSRASDHGSLVQHVW